MVLSPDRGAHGLLVLQHGQYEAIPLDLVFPVLHGKLGEDGAIQGLLELSGIPYVGCDIQSSALCMDKSLAYVVASSAGIATPEFWTLTANQNIVPDRLRYPVFVKPARSGSSFGVSESAGKAELPDAIKHARQLDSKVLVEEAVVGSEVGCAILGERFGLVTGEVAKSPAVIPPSEWVESRMPTLFHEIDMSGWWFISSAGGVIRLTKSTDAWKSSNVNSPHQRVAVAAPPVEALSSRRSISSSLRTAIVLLVRIASLVPSATEMLFALGLGDSRRRGHPRVRLSARRPDSCPSSRAA